MFELFIKQFYHFVWCSEKKHKVKARELQRQTHKS